MVRYWWTYSYDPVRREVAVQRWRQRGNLNPKLDQLYEGLTWREALDVLEMDSWSLVRDAVVRER